MPSPYAAAIREELDGLCVDGFAVRHAAFPNANDFNAAARAWQSPKNQRTLATH